MCVERVRKEDKEEWIVDGFADGQRQLRGIDTIGFHPGYTECVASVSKILEPRMASQKA